MTDKQSFIDLIKSKVLSENELFDEALMCYKNGCNRSAYIVAWITIVESLKQKISSFADMGDVTSKNAWTRIEAKEKSKASADSLIAEEAIKCNIVQDSEESRLTFLWAQRCIFAHPYQEKPTDEQVAHILTEAVNITLGKDINFNKAYLENLCKQIVNHPHFLPNDAAVRKAYFKQIMPRVPDILHSVLFKNILKEIAAIETDLSKNKELMKLRRFLVELVVQTKQSLSDSQFQLEIGITMSPYTCWVGYVHLETWSKIPDRAKGMLMTYMLSEADASKAHKMYNILSKIGLELEPKYQAQFHTLLDDREYGIAMQFHIDANAAFDRTINELQNGWTRQNRVGQYFYSEGSRQLVDKLSMDQKMQLGRKFKLAKAQNAWDARDFVDDVLNGNVEFSDHFKAGIAIGYIIPSDARFSLPGKHEIFKMIEIFNDLEVQEITDGYRLMNELIGQHEPIRHESFQDEMFSTYAAEATATIKNSAQIELFDTFIGAVKSYMGKAKSINLN